MTPWAIAAVKARMKRVSEVKKAIKTLPNVPELSLRVLSVEDDSEEDVLKAIAKYTGSSNNAAFITEHKLLTLPRIDAMELYTSLRLLEAIVAVKPHTSSVVATRTAAKSKRKQVKNPRIQITGLEKLNSNVGIIK